LIHIVEVAIVIGGNSAGAIAGLADVARRILAPTAAHRAWLGVAVFVFVVIVVRLGGPGI
jgi:hypothetical protein